MQMGTHLISTYLTGYGYSQAFMRLFPFVILSKCKLLLSIKSHITCGISTFGSSQYPSGIVDKGS